MPETKQIPVITEVNTTIDTIDIYSYYQDIVDSIVNFFINIVVKAINGVSFLEGELGFTKNVLPDFNASVNDQGELIVVDIDADIYFIDGVGNLISGTVLIAPVAIAASNILIDSFTVNWNAVTGATKYYLDIATDAQFNTYLTGYQNRDVGSALSEVVTDLDLSTSYYYRIRAYSGVQMSLDSNIIAALTLTPVPIQSIFVGTSPSGLILKSVDGGLTFSNEDSSDYGNPTAFIFNSDGDLVYCTDTGYVFNYSENVLVGVRVSSSPLRCLYQAGSVLGVGGDDGYQYFYNIIPGEWSGGYNLGSVIYATISPTYVPSNGVWATYNGIYSGNNILLQAGIFTSICCISNTILYAGEANGHIWKSVNSGANWTDLGAVVNYPCNSIIGIGLLNNGYLVVISDTGNFTEIILTNNDFSTKINYTTGSDNERPVSMIILNNTIFIGRDDGDVIGFDLANPNSSLSIDILNNPQQGESSINALINDNHDIVLGTQVWMRKNINVSLPESKAYDDNQLNVEEYGGLYSLDMIEEIELYYPGYHVPTEAEWDTFITYMGGINVIGGKLKEMGFDHWNSPNTGADNIGGLCVRGAGKEDGGYSDIKEHTYLMTSTFAGPLVRYMRIDVDSDILVKGQGDFFMSVRLIKD